MIDINIVKDIRDDQFRVAKIIVDRRNRIGYYRQLEVKMEPSKGRIVNYHCIKGEEYLGPDEDMILPAIITRVYKGSPVNAVDLTIFTNQPSSLIARRTSVAMGMTNGGGWTWPSIIKDSLVIEQPQTITGGMPPKVGPSIPLPKVG